MRQEIYLENDDCYQENEKAYIVEPEKVSMANISEFSKAYFTNLGYNNQIFVGHYVGEIFLIMDKTIVKEFDGCINHYMTITSIVFVSYGYMATSCADKLYLFYSNGTYNHKRLTSRSYNMDYLAYDSKGRFVMLSYSEICM